MGQAKRRGTCQQRVEQAIARNKALLKEQNLVLTASKVALVDDTAKNSRLVIAALMAATQSQSKL